MTLTRRSLLGSGAAMTTAAVAHSLAAVSEADAERSPAAAMAEAACQALPAASPAVVAMSRLSNGVSARDLAAFNALGATPDERYERWVEQQLNPGIIDDGECEARVAAARLKIRYGAVNEARPLQLLAAPIEQLWPRASSSATPEYSERMRPYDEVRVATWLRAVHSRRELYEVLVDFWHNHFNVHPSSD